MPVRRIARPMLAVGYIAAGWDAVRHPREHVARLEAAWTDLATRVDVLPAPDRRALPNLVRTHGAAMMLAGASLALGRTPRLSGLTLAALSAPVLLMDQPWLPRAPRVERAARLERTVRDSAMVGAALLVAADLNGRPGLGWRVSHAFAERTKAAKAAVTD